MFLMWKGGGPKLDVHVACANLGKKFDLLINKFMIFFGGLCLV